MCIICDNQDNLENILMVEKIICEGCFNITTIPYLPNLKELYCQCTKVTKIDNLPSLEIINCSKSGVISITNTPRLRQIYCNWSYNLDLRAVKKYFDSLKQKKLYNNKQYVLEHEALKVSFDIEKNEIYLLEGNEVQEIIIEMKDDGDLDKLLM